MVSECCLSFTKYFVFLFNLIFFFLGMLMLSLGVWITWAESSFFMEPPSFMSMSLLSTSLVIAGSLSTALGFLGCMGAVQEAKCMLGLYFMLLTILLAAQCVGGVLFVTQRDLFESSLMDHMSGVIQLYGKNESHLRHFEKTLDYIQEEVGCCGWESHFDWDSAPCSCYYFNSSHHASPNATTATTSTATTLPCGCKGRDLSRTTQCAIYKQGCRRQVEEWMDDHMLTILVVIFALIAVESVLWLWMLVFHCLSCSPRRCCPPKSRGRRLHISSDFYMEYWQDLWYDPFDVSV